jgi:hypothetical protein
VKFGHQQILPALLRAQHPSSPEADPGLRFMQTLDISKFPPRLQPLLTHLCLTVTQLLLSEKKYEDASWCLAFAKKNLPDLLASTPREGRQVSENLTKVPDERTSLDLLDKLALS